MVDQILAGHHGEKIRPDHQMLFVTLLFDWLLHFYEPESQSTREILNSSSIEGFEAELIILIVAC